MDHVISQNSRTNPSYEHASFIEQQSIFKKATESTLRSIDRIDKLAIAIFASCIAAIWAVPLDLVFYSGAAKIAAIPVGLLALPVLLFICLIARIPFENRLKKVSSEYHPHLLQELLRSNRQEEALHQEYIKVRKMIKSPSLDLSSSFVPYISNDQLRFLIRSSPRITHLTLNAALLSGDFLEVVAQNLTRFDRIAIKRYDSFPEEYRKKFDEQGYAVRAEGSSQYFIEKRSTDCNSSSVYIHQGNYGGYSGSAGTLSCQFQWR
jgi:hypothetical protein